MDRCAGSPRFTDQGADGGMIRKSFVLAAVFLFVMASAAALAPVLASSSQDAIPKPVQPSPQDRCAVCGMFVAKHKDFLAEFVFRDGSYAVFDGAKDMFRCYFDIAASLPGKTRKDIAAIYVTDYYSLKLIDGARAFFVAGSDILGPMGAELIPLAGEKDARSFLADHKGRSILKFSDVTPQLVKGLD